MRPTAGFFLTALLALTAVPMGVLSATYSMLATKIFFDEPVEAISIGQIKLVAIPLLVAACMLGGAGFSSSVWKDPRWKSWSFPIALVLAASAILIVWRVYHMTLN
jgi:hypothetical protein